MVTTGSFVPFQNGGCLTAKKAHISLIAIPDALMSTLSGIYDVLSSFEVVAAVDVSVPANSPFHVEIISETECPVMLASGLPVSIHRRIDQVKKTDIVIVPSVLVSEEQWQKDRYPALVEWLKDMHGQGAALCSACSGLFLLAETGLFDGNEAAVHWAYAQKFRQCFPNVPVIPDKVLVVAGDNQQLISSGASTSWHDLVLYVISSRVTPSAALAVSRFFALEWHRDGLAPYIVFSPRRDHGDAEILSTQDWLSTHFTITNPVEEMTKRSGLVERTFKRRFTAATGLPPISYVQHLRIEESKRLLEQTRSAIDEIGWKVGYEEPAFFRRLFKRITGITPGAYRRKFKLPDFTV